VKVHEKGVLSEEENQLLMSKPNSKIRKLDGDNYESLLIKE
jgi:hypothetical protein